MNILKGAELAAGREDRLDRVDDVVLDGGGEGGEGEAAENGADTGVAVLRGEAVGVLSRPLDDGHGGVALAEERDKGGVPLDPEVAGGVVEGVEEGAGERPRARAELDDRIARLEIELPRHLGRHRPGAGPDRADPGGVAEEGGEEAGGIGHGGGALQTPGELAPRVGAGEGGGFRITRGGPAEQVPRASSGVRRVSVAYDDRMPGPALIECFDNPSPGRVYMIEHVAEEFTSVCPKTGHPDFGSVVLRYAPAAVCVELKSLKLYLQAFRNEGIFYEAVTNRIADDLAAAMQPRWMVVETSWRGRGGIRSAIRVETGERPDRLQTI